MGDSGLTVARSSWKGAHSLAVTGLLAIGLLLAIRVRAVTGWLLPRVRLTGLLAIALLAVSRLLTITGLRAITGLLTITGLRAITGLLTIAGLLTITGLRSKAGLRTIGLLPARWLSPRVRLAGRWLSRRVGLGRLPVACLTTRAVAPQRHCHPLK